MHIVKLSFIEDLIIDNIILETIWVMVNLDIWIMVKVWYEMRCKAVVLK